MSDTTAKISNTKFQSPIPALFKLRNFVFGKNRPGIFTQITFYINLFAFLVFALWSVISFGAIKFRSIFLKEKGVDVEALIGRRGLELGFTNGVFMQRLEIFHFISLICWGVLFFSLILLWRKRNVFVVFYFGATIVYISSLFLYLGYDYYISDTTFFDKIIFLIMNAYTFFYYLLSSHGEFSKIDLSRRTRN